MAESTRIRARGAGNWERPALPSVHRQGRHAPASPSLTAPRGITEVGDFFHEFERLILLQYEEHPERAREIFMNIDDVLSLRIIELERRKESLRRLREKIRTLLMLEGDPETPWPSQVPSTSNRGSPSPLREVRGRECSVKDY
jgi:hypothetical protein